jgi:glycosyltransferase involved in cell wall biosynthesis
MKGQFYTSGHILILVNSLYGGGAETSMRNLHAELLNQGAVASLVGINSTPNFDGRHKPNVFVIGREWRSGTISTFRGIQRFRKLMKKASARTIILNCDLPEFFGIFSPRHVKIIVVEHSPKPFGTRKRLGLVIRTALTMRGCHWVSVSEHLNIWPYNQKSTVIKNAISDIESRSCGIKPNSPIKRLAFVGRLANPQKRPEFLFYAAREAHLEVVFIGTGKELKNLKKSAESLKVKTTFSGYIENPFLDFDKGDLLVIPSIWEGDGLVVLEAMKLGVPLLLSDIPDFRRFNLKEKHYFKDESDLARIVMDCKNVSEFVVSKDDTDRILQERDVKSIARKWLDYIAQIK